MFNSDGFMMPPHPNPLPRWGEGTFFNLLSLGGNSGDTILNLSKSARRQKKLSMVSPELRVPGAAAGKPFKTLFFGIDFYFRHDKNLLYQNTSGQRICNRIGHTRVRFACGPCSACLCWHCRAVPLQRVRRQIRKVTAEGQRPTPRPP